MTLHYIKDLGILLELQNYDSSHNFDRISTLLIYMFILKYLEIKPRNQDNDTTDTRSIYDSIYN